MLHIHIPINDNCPCLRVILKPNYIISCVIRTTLKLLSEQEIKWGINTNVGQLYFFYVLPSSFLKQIQEEISHLIQELIKLHSEITNLKNQIVSQSKEISSSRGIYMNMYVNSIYITKAYNECNIMSDF